MSFKVNWPQFSPEFLETARKQLSEALNSGKKPDNIAGDIIVKQLVMGSKPPELEILEIGDLSPDRFKGIFKLVYQGDGYIDLQTAVQANPLCISTPPMVLTLGRPMLAAAKPLVVPMDLRISQVRLRGIIVLVVDKEKGVTLVFKNDPLESVVVNSVHFINQTFDNIPNIRRLLQSRIENQFRNLFQEELPQMVHKLSLIFLQKQREVEVRSEPQRSVSPASHGYYDFDGYASDSGYHSDKQGERPRRRKNPSYHPRWSGNDFDNFETSRVNVIYRSLDRNEEIGLRVADSPEKPVRELADEEYTALDMRREMSGGYTHHIGLSHTQKSHVGYFPIMPTSHLSALEFNRRKRSPSVSSRASMESSKTAPALFRQGQIDEMVWHRPEEPLERTRPLVDKPRLRAFPHSSLESLHRRKSHMSPLAESPQRMPKSPSSVVLEEPDNEISAHLASLMSSNHTITPNSNDLQHLAFRGMPAINVPRSPSSSTAFENSFGARRRVGVRRVHMIKLDTSGIRVLQSQNSAVSEPKARDTRSV